MSAGTVSHQIWRDALFEDVHNELIIDVAITSVEGGEKILSVDADIWRTAYPGAHYEISDLRYGHEKPLSFAWPDGFEMSGTLNWISYLETSREYQLVGSISIGPNRPGNVWSYNGFIAQFGPVKSSNVPPPPDPSEVPPAES